MTLMFQTIGKTGHIALMLNCIQCVENSKDQANARYLKSANRLQGTQAQDLSLCVC